MTHNLLPWIFLIISLLLDLLVVAIKTSYSHARLPYLLNLREGREDRIEMTVHLIEEPRLRVGLYIAHTFLHFALAGFFVTVMLSILPSLSMGLLFLYLMVAVILLIFLEYALKARVMRATEEYAIRFNGVAGVLNTLFSPLASTLLAVLGPNAKRLTLASMTEEDLKNWVEVGQHEGSLEKGEREMIYSIFQFGDTLAKEIMVPRIDVIMLDIHSTLGEARRAFIQGGHSRVPVYEETVDNVVGLLYAKDLLSLQQDDALIADHRELLRLAYFVPEAKKVDEVLAEMQSRNMHLAIVVDEYGGVAGVVTLEDIVEEIIGEIRDEYDESEELPYLQVGENEYVFQGRVDLDIFNEVMETNIAIDNADTIGGFIYSEIGDVPTGGEELHCDGLTLIVEQVDGRRIVKVRARKDALESTKKGHRDVNG
ncbi:MAG: HlyC/CorC family transporter [Chloroflexi bacterium]|nr:HlyC/CorC family transporter [Chloroflexota bacterium]